MDESALNITMTKAGMTETLNPTHHISKGNWRQGLWNASKEEGWPWECDTIVVLNSSPHWTTWPLHPATDKHIIKGYTTTMASVQEFFASLPPRPIMAFICATVAAHQNCNVHSSPVPANSTTASDSAPPGDKFGWHLFATFNRIAQEFFLTPKMRFQIYGR
ncbi:uncharacterized protein LACBIDRAFT_299381 [Laccaria bicolor S238N-H82]|uniref:Predicted protein n=1 Tax=Laccaria bicolor (strain S238N-H82 / ATCC MYA-4686) TaxID=486041 RepID=B0DEL5_LACBS|nr:uncharacterized protein LACBIDRAFT_299381 [Laccaria bicolor S238N-H82]EDR07053.1 predicted protein [Laccaria bicolor S238N-H82]|eukprot:XP_001882426.1 predicted protein [Laccaria bicolor S238N-H82]